MNGIIPVVLAAGQGTRMRSDLPKVLHHLLGKPMLNYVLDTLRELEFNHIGVVIGYKQELVKKKITGEDINFILQQEQLGTGHALMCAESFWENAEHVLVLNGDVPLLHSSTLKELMISHLEQNAAISLLIAKTKCPEQYGIVVKDKNGQIKGILEITERGKFLEPTEINAGIYCFKTSFLKAYLPKLKLNPRKKEYYLTDLIALAADNNEKIVAKEAPYNEIIGINTKRELAKAMHVLREEVLKKHMLNGVTIIVPEATYIEPDVSIGKDTIVYPGVYLQGNTKIGEKCILGVGVIIKDSEIGNEVEIKPYCVITDSTIEDKATVGPFAHLRPGAHIGKEARIGNFVEVKKSYIGSGSKACHLTYIGDAEIGKGVNIGAGTITCNYDGVRKHKTTIEDAAFIGSNTALIAPVKIGKGALVGAGSVITDDVPPNTLAIARAKQTHKQKRRK
ncbi:MAG TPA: UDP-N-acetylglucosamine diphosphorylase/glucosamine-1-phosphate N-acetyltransferase [Candidatus Desulfofervidus auxilii]|uniref:Bifunctional protein GlmU n=1 Tax=Desulfofervidus auxilii TaxID=1621989 RepID=A0A7V0NEH9_DESA2|nr:UDP-N-acetylglucosamine diphosphorylase/glucosamine-1-phosphate N-acetyltransferase [Candidatus Desulfofervidus auxilii]